MSIGLALLFALLYAGAEPHETAEPFPRVQALPQPFGEVAFDVDGQTVAAYRYDAAVGRAFVYPFLGPAERGITRMGHPHDPHGHRHHRSIWVAHRDVGGVSFWEDSEARIVQEKVLSLSDGAKSASLQVLLRWENGEGKSLLHETRTLTLHNLQNGERYLDIAMEFVPEAEAITLGKTPFGFLGVRVAKTMGVHDGGGRVLNSEGQVNEPQVHWQHARWVDYSGQAVPGVINGISLFDHPANPNFPTVFHVRDDGWMGACLTYEESLEMRKAQPLKLWYRLHAHGEDTTAETIEEHWKAFSGERAR